MDDLPSDVEAGACPRTFTVVGPPYLSELLLAACVAAPGTTMRALHASAGAVRQRLVDAVPSTAELGFDAAIVVGDGVPNLVEPWGSVPCGVLVYGLFTSLRVGRSLPGSPCEDDVRDLPFVSPLGLDDDRCPFPRSARWITHEVDDLRSACRVAADADRLVHAPQIVAAAFVRDGALVELPVGRWRTNDPVHLVVHRGHVGPRVESELADVLRRALGSYAAQSGVVGGEPPLFVGPVARASV